MDTKLSKQISIEERPPLFDVRSEGVPKESALSLIVPLVVNLTLIILVIFIARRLSAYFMSRVKLKDKVLVLLPFILMLSVFTLPGRPAQAALSLPSEGFLPLGVLSSESPALFDVSSGYVNMLVDTGNGGLLKVAPGEFLPVSIELANFGGGKRVDVLLLYEILTSTEEKIYETSETVAVETTASFIKKIQIPIDTVAGTYTVKTSIKYMGQVTPATTQFPFVVEKKFFGLFKTDFYVYAEITIMFILLGITPVWLLIRKRERRGILHDYSDKPHDERIYYEMVSDIITQMRLRAGDQALKIAGETGGLVVDKGNGRVLSITDSPAKVVAGLVDEYDKMLGKKVSFSLRPDPKL